MLKPPPKYVSRTEPTPERVQQVYECTHQANMFCRYLGCYTAHNVSEAMRERDAGLHDKTEYRQRLTQLIEVNKNRHDTVGLAETLAAKRELEVL